MNSADQRFDTFPRGGKLIIGVLLLLCGSGCDKNRIESMRKELKSSIESFGAKREPRAMPKARKEPEEEGSGFIDSDLREQARLLREDAAGVRVADKQVAKTEELQLDDEQEEKSETKEEAEPSELEPAFEDEKDGSPLADDSDFPDLAEEENAGLEESAPGRKDQGRVKKSEAKVAKKGPEEPPPAADALKSCPNKGKLQGASPPKGLEQWCENKEGLRDGPFRKWHRNGSRRLDGTFVKDKLDGVIVSYSPEGDKLESREYKLGKLDGVSIKWSATGDRLLEVTYKGGRKEGPFVTYDRTGRKKNQGSYRNEKKDGVWIVYSRTGTPRTKVTWELGKKSGPAEQYFPSGQKMVLATYSKDKLDGPYLALYKDGKKKTEGFYSAGLKHGVWTQFRRDGSVGRQMKFDNGVRQASEGRERGRGRQQAGGDDLSVEERYNDTKRRALRGNRNQRRERNRGRESQEQIFRDPNEDTEALEPEGDDFEGM